MSKYYLTAAYYNGKEFINEVAIDHLKGYSLNSLQDIDLFTASHSLQEIIQILSQDYDIDPRSFVSIKRYKNANATPDYYQAIIYNANYYQAISGMREIVYSISGHKMRTLAVSKDNPFYQSEFLKLDEMLNKKDIASFEKMYPYDNAFSTLVRRYMSDGYDNDLEKEKDYFLLKTEFSRYKTFRSWIMVQEKAKKRKNQSVKSHKSTKTIQDKQSTEAKSIEEYEEEFVRMFKQKKNISYDSYEVSKYNLAHLEEDKEEFLNEEEFFNMNHSKIKK